MGTVRQFRQQRQLDNPKSRLGRVYLVMRDATYWMQLHDIAGAIEARFGHIDTTEAIEGHLREMKASGHKVLSRLAFAPRGVSPREYRLVDDWNEGARTA